jgi:hypothetical protein
MERMTHLCLAPGMAVGTATAPTHRGMSAPLVMAEAALNRAPFGSATKRRPIRARTFRSSAKARFALAWPLSRQRFSAVRYRGSGDVRSPHLAEGNFLRAVHPGRLGWPLFGWGLKALSAIRFIARTMPILANSSGPRSSAASISI